ncbi:MAG: monoterpene epsilon-lactone hydrolase [Candidatus Azotimanducaceae bacterium]|jgi:monoterpene epsilon-lactone hydrolase
MYLFLIITLIVISTLYLISLGYRAADHSQFDLPQDPLVIASADISANHATVVEKLKAFQRQSGLKIENQRQRMEALFFQEVDAQIIPVDVAGIESEWVLATNADPDKRLLYLHGGAFRVGSPRTHRYITAELSRRAGVAVLAIDYRMQPEFKTIHCHADARTAYQWILENGPKGSGKPSEVYVAGDSAGGNLTLSVIAWARDTGKRAVDGAIALAPLTDATMSSPTWASNQKTDPFLGPSIGLLLKLPRTIVYLAQRLSGGAAPNNSMLSPLLGELSNLPPILLQASADEMLYGDAQRYANKARAAGIDVTLQLWPQMVHVFQGFGPDLPEAQDALQRIADFIAIRSKAADASSLEQNDHI